MEGDLEVVTEVWLLEAPAPRVGVDGRHEAEGTLDAGGGDGHREPLQHHLRQLAPMGARADPVARRLRLGEGCETGVRLDVDEHLEGPPLLHRREVRVLVLHGRRRYCRRPSHRGPRDRP